MVAVDLSGAACAARKRAVFHAMGSKTIPRSPAFPPVLTSYKLLEIERRKYLSAGHLHGSRGGLVCFGRIFGVNHGRLEHTAALRLFWCSCWHSSKWS